MAKKKNAAKTAAKITLGELAETFLEHLDEAKKSRGTVFGYSLDLGVALRHFGKEKLAADLTEKNVEAFFHSKAVTLTRDGRKKGKLTVDRTRRAFRLMLSWAAAEGMIPTAPIPASALPKPRVKAKKAKTTDKGAAKKSKKPEAKEGEATASNNGVAA